MVVTEIARPRPGDQVIPSFSSLRVRARIAGEEKWGRRREAEASRTKSGIYRRKGMGHGQVGPTCFGAQPGACW
jgi:hypothetical protein